jgi:rod shape-determining protein MreC
MASLNRRFKYFIIIIIIIVLSLVMITVSYRQSELVQGIKAKTVDILKPVQEKLVLFFNPITRFFNSINDYIKLRDKYIKLQEENSELRCQYSENINLKLENDALRKLLGIELREDHQTIPAKVIGYYENRWQSEVILNAGSGDGVLEGMAVVNEDGLVGMVAVNGKDSCTVRLINDPQTKIGARILSSRKLGVIQGSQDRKISLNYILSEEQVFKGDIVVTSEYGNFPGEILIGRVSRVLENAGDPYKSIEIEPFVDFKKMEYVLIIKE